MARRSPRRTEVCLAVGNRTVKDTFDFRVVPFFPNFPKDKLRVGRLVYLRSDPVC